MPTYEARRLNDRESTAPAKLSTRTLKKERAGRRYDARNLTIDPVHIPRGPFDERTVMPSTSRPVGVAALVRTTRDRSGWSAVVGSVRDDDAVGEGHLCGTELEDAARLSVRTDRTVPRDDRPGQCSGATGGEDSGPHGCGGRVGVAGGVGEHLALPERGLAAGVDARARHPGSGGRVPVHLAAVQGQHAHVFQGGRRSARRGGGVAGNLTVVEGEGADIGDPRAAGERG